MKHLVFSRAGIALLFVLFASSALAVDTTFVLDEQASSLTIDASTVFVVPLSDSDTQQLGGTIETTLDFGMSGVFPSQADLTANSGSVSPLNPFALTLGSPPTLGVDVDIDGAVANVTTPNPPTTLTLLPTALVRYSFDASHFVITLDQGTVTVSGAVNETIDLAMSPVIGVAQPGTLGELTFLNIAQNGPFTDVDAQLDLPVEFTEIIDVDGQMVTLDVSGTIIANSSFQVALSGLPGDFDDDGDVDGADLNGTPDGWQSRFGNDLSAADFLDWQRNYGLGTAPSPIAAVPEPSCGVMVLTLLGYLATNPRRGCDGKS